MKQTLEIRKFSYLKTPLFSWILTNDLGGAFSNSGNHRSFKKCLEHAQSMISRSEAIKVGSSIIDMRQILDVKVIDVDINGNETIINGGN